MAEYEDDFTDEDSYPENEDFDSDEGFESDPGTVAYLDQQGAEFAAQREQFLAMYGFDHDCRCANDYAEGKLAQVTECYLELTDDALETCARLNWENQTLQGMVKAMVQMNDDLMKVMEDEEIDVDPDQILRDAFLATVEDAPEEDVDDGETPELS